MVRLVLPPPPLPSLPNFSTLRPPSSLPPPSCSPLHLRLSTASSSRGVISAALASPALPGGICGDPQPTRSPPQRGGARWLRRHRRRVHPPTCHTGWLQRPPPRGSASKGSFVRTGRGRHAVTGKPAPVDLPLPSIPGWGGANRSSCSADPRSVPPSVALTSPQQPLLSSSLFPPPSPLTPPPLGSPRWPSATSSSPPSHPLPLGLTPPPFALCPPALQCCRPPSRSPTPPKLPLHVGQVVGASPFSSSPLATLRQATFIS